MMGIGRVCQNQDSLDWLDSQDFAAFHIRRAQGLIAVGDSGSLGARASPPAEPRLRASPSP